MTLDKKKDPAADRLAKQHQARMAGVPFIEEPAPGPTAAEALAAFAHERGIAKAALAEVERLKTEPGTVHAPLSPEVEGLIADAVKEAGGTTSLENVRGLITQECRALETLLLEKNSGYGNSVLEPLRVFSRASPVAGCLVRIDDKLSRIARGDLTVVADEKLPQTVDDLMGYLVLLKVAWRLGLR